MRRRETFRTLLLLLLLLLLCAACHTDVIDCVSISEAPKPIIEDKKPINKDTF